VLGFLNTARKGENELAREYLNTRLGPKQAEELAHQLFVVLDARLPARLTQLSDEPEGSHANPLTPDQDVVGVVESLQGTLDIVVERVDRGSAGPVWVFSRQTLDSIPDVYQEIVESQNATVIRRLLRGLAGGRSPIRRVALGSARRRRLLFRIRSLESDSHTPDRPSVEPLVRTAATVEG
jgi:hypothetical protein